MIRSDERGSVPLLLRRAAEQHGDRSYLCFDGETWTHAQALEQAERFAAFLRALGECGGGARCAAYLPNCPQALWTWFGTLLAGSVYVPLNRAQRGALLEDQLRRARASVLVTDAEASELPELADAGVRHVVIVNRQGEWAMAAEVHDWAASQSCGRWVGATADPSALASVMFSSGSTGRAKAVMLPHNQSFRGAAQIASALGLGAHDVWHAWLPHYHLMGQLYAFLSPLAAGACAGMQTRFSRTRFWAEVRAADATVIAGMANLLRGVSTIADDTGSYDNPARLALVVGVDREFKRRFAERFAVRVVDCYGLTEAEPITMPSDDGTHGVACDDFELSIVDDDDVPLGAGTVGQIVFRPRRPDVMFQGYEDDPTLTVSSWRNLWFHTGDIGHLDDARRLIFSGRRAWGIRHLGDLSAWELEQTMLRCPGVASAVAIGVPVGDGEDDVKIVIVPSPGAALSAEALHAWCGENVARFVVPRYIELVDELPTFGIGKVDRATLARVGPNVWDASSAKASPKSPTEERER